MCGFESTSKFLLPKKNERYRGINECVFTATKITVLNVAMKLQAFEPTYMETYDVSTTAKSKNCSSNCGAYLLTLAQQCRLKGNGPINVAVTLFCLWVLAEH